MHLKFLFDGKPFDTEVVFTGNDNYLVKVGGKNYKIKKFKTSLGLILKEGDELFEIAAKNAGRNEFDIFLNNIPHRVLMQTSMREIKTRKVSKKHVKIEKDIFSPLFGAVSRIFVETGVPVKKGERLVSITSMKMENMVLAPNKGIIEKVFVEKGQRVAEDQLLVKFK